MRLDDVAMTMTKVTWKLLAHFLEKIRKNDNPTFILYVDSGLECILDYVYLINTHVHTIISRLYIKHQHSLGYSKSAVMCEIMF